MSTKSNFEFYRGTTLDDEWDEVFLYTVLSIVRSDLSGAHGFAPGHLIMGRPYVNPFEIEKEDVDMSGNTILYFQNHTLFRIYSFCKK